MRSRALLGPALYAGIVIFGITMLFRINAPNIGWAAVFIYLPFTVLAIHILTRRESWGDDAAIERHLADFPVRARSSCLEANERAQARTPTRHRIGAALSNFRRVWQASVIELRRRTQR